MPMPKWQRGHEAEAEGNRRIVGRYSVGFPDFPAALAAPIASLVDVFGFTPLCSVVLPQTFVAPLLCRKNTGTKTYLVGC